jgi:hypothetical protein
MESNQKSAIPPYVPYRTFTNFLDKFKQGVPGRIDRQFMAGMSGGAQSQVTAALRYLGFISGNNLPLDLMKTFVVAEGDERKKLLKDIIEKSYPFLFDAHFDLSTATASQLREAIEENTSATGATVSRCIAFFKDAALDAGFSVSPYIKQKKPRNGVSRKRIASLPKQPPADPNEHKHPPNLHFTEHPHQTHIEAQNSLLLWGLFQRLPKPGSVWPKEQREQWTQTLNNVLALEYKEQ